MNNPEQLFELAATMEDEGRLEAAFQLLLQAALLGHTSSQINLGNFYTEGRGTAKDVQAGRSWYERAYLAGERSGAANLGIDSRNRGDLTNAVLWLRRAANQDDGDACVDLAELLFDPAERAELLRKALSLPPKDTSDDGRERAETLLAELP